MGRVRKSQAWKCFSVFCGLVSVRGRENLSTADKESILL